MKSAELSCTHFSQPIIYIFNLSFVRGKVSDELNIAKVLPLFESGDATIVNNYRPVSVLPWLSKIFDKLMCRRLLSFLKKQNILHHYQFGFRANQSTNLALIFIVDKIIQALQNGDTVIGVFLYFSISYC